MDMTFERFEELVRKERDLELLGKTILSVAGLNYNKNDLYVYGNSEIITLMKSIFPVETGDKLAELIDAEMVEIEESEEE